MTHRVFPRTWRMWLFSISSNEPATVPGVSETGLRGLRDQRQVAGRRIGSPLAQGCSPARGHCPATDRLRAVGERVGEPLEPPPDPKGEFLQEEHRQQRDVLGALAERRESDREHAEAVVQVFAERLFVDGLEQVAIGRRDHADVDRLRGPPTRSNSCSWRTRSSLPGCRRGARRSRRGRSCRRQPARTGRCDVRSLP